jgi:hypothetical protein
MHGKDVTFPKGTEITAYVDGEINLERDRFVAGGAPLPAGASETSRVRSTAATSNPSPPVPAGTPGGLIDIAFTSNPPGALVSMYGSSLGRTPFTTRLAPGTNKAMFSADGYHDLTQSISVGPGNSTIVNATFELKR